MPGSSAALEDQLSDFEVFGWLSSAMSTGVRVVVMRILETRRERAVVVFFVDDRHPGSLFAYRCMPPGTDVHEPVWLGEELATGGLARVMRRGRPAADPDGVVWLELRDLQWP
ncbi:MAG: hypothetical protein ACRDWE_00310 [Acidimicrobiales bacterium]